MTELCHNGLWISLLLTLAVLLIISTGSVNGRSRRSKKSIEKIHKFFTDEYDYSDPWDDLREDSPTFSDLKGGVKHQENPLINNKPTEEKQAETPSTKTSKLDKQVKLDRPFRAEFTVRLPEEEQPPTSTPQLTQFKTNRLEVIDDAKVDATVKTHHAEVDNQVKESKENVKTRDEAMSDEPLSKKSVKTKHALSRDEKESKHGEHKTKDTADHKTGRTNLIDGHQDGGCRTMHCRLGRTCRADDRGRTSCVCAEPDHCAVHRRGTRNHGREVAEGDGGTSRWGVCGSNGKFYSSHCEMHRQACITGEHIRANNDRRACSEKAHEDNDDNDDYDDDDNDDESDSHDGSHHTVKKESASEEDLMLNVQKNIMKEDENLREKKGDAVDGELLAVGAEDEKVTKRPAKDLMKFFKTSVVTGNGLEIKCEIDRRSSPDSPAPQWKRNGRLISDLVDDDIQVFADGSLYFSQVELYHIGNYSCVHPTDTDIVQTHLLAVTVPPVVLVSPSSQVHIPGAAVSVECQTSGIPQPDITWRFSNNQSRNVDTPHLLLQHGHTIQLQNIGLTMDGTTLTCKAENSAGSAEASAVAYVKSMGSNSHESTSQEFYVVFHAEGYTVYEPNHCHIMHVVSGDFSVGAGSVDSAAVTTLCGGANVTCSWGEAVRVGSKFIYVTQPKLNRVVIIELMDRFNPMEVIETDQNPKEISYVEHLDQIWVLCHANVQGGETDSSTNLLVAKTNIIIRQASVDLHHRTVHIQPLAGEDEFATVRLMFLPPNTDLHVNLKYGYAAVGREMALYKVDLTALKFVKQIVLQCIPEDLAFVPIGGKVVVSCMKEETSPQQPSVLIDYVTDGILISAIDVSGMLRVSPDLRQLVAVKRDSVTIYRVQDNGDIKLALSHSLEASEPKDLVFVSAASSDANYDVFIRCTDRILYIDGQKGHVTNVEGEGDLMKVKHSSNSRGDGGAYIIASAGAFSDYLMSTAAEDDVIIIDAERHRMQCQWHGAGHVSAIVGVKVI